MKAESPVYSTLHIIITTSAEPSRMVDFVSERPKPRFDA